MKIVRNLLLLVGLLLGWQHLASAQVFEWARLAHNLGSNGSIGQGSTTDPAGNTYVGIGFKDSARVGGQTLAIPNGSNLGGGSLHIVKYDSTGQVAWIKRLTNMRLPFGIFHSLEADPVNGGFFLIGDMRGGATWGGAAVPGAAGLSTTYTSFYGKCDASGNLLWTRPVGFQIYSSPTLTVDGLGNCYLANQVTSTTLPATVGGMPIDSTERFVLGNNASGTGEWVRRLRATPLPPPTQPYAPRCPSGINHLKLGPQAAGGCLLFGSFNEALYFGAPGTPPVLPSRTALHSFDDFIASVSPSGVLTWIRPGRGGSTATNPAPNVEAAAADLAGNYYVAGCTVQQASTGYQQSFTSAAKYGPTGNLLWVTTQPTQTFLSGSPVYITNYATELVVDRDGELTMLVTSDLRPVLTPATIGSFTLTDEYSLVHLNAAGVPQWTAASRSAGDAFPQTTTSYSDPAGLGLDGRGNVYYTTSAGSTSPNNISPNGNGLTPPTYLLGQLTQVGAGISVARIGTKHNTVRGRLYLDANGNGVQDGSEGAFPRTMVLQAVQATQARLGSFDTTGVFNVYVGPGAYTLAAPVAPLHYTLTQPTSGPYTGSFSGYGNVDTNRNFGFTPVANQTDLRATLVAYGAARPGFDGRQRLTLDNVGTSTIPAGTATITLDGQVTFIGSYPSTTTTGRVVRWNYPAIPPLSRRTLDVSFNIPAGTALGTSLAFAASAPVAADVLPTDNSSATAQTVTGSFDPNDIAVSYERLSPTDVAAQLPLDYTIRFQNMGTDTAFTVVVTDTLDFRKLDLTTLELLAESHPCTWSISGAGSLVLRFLNIHLPYKAQNELGSQGFVRFRVLPKTTLNLGDLVLNKADIFFDYNAPVRTNTAQTAVLLPTALTADARTTAFAAYPNPAHSSLTVAAELRTAGTVQLTLLDALGRPVQQQRLAAAAGALRHTLAVSSLRPGIYVLRLTLPDGSSTSQRLAVE
ncbi:T9SS type A sorting domain-containing protein [Hymenobacter sp. ASUV-10]|uniref:T9SS type A sorting domain-containing protein n=1 Tax=Hymenobacter aranciens TaxID=3063996 RepID=A0ABT9BA60_9BACT|nr:T9SS type A sorting domain-containing protein [Hymenobacter sp. ASUV-10]MDO7875151.1 T9SS type A sorting domain-containing protein [Hymenobacter sp. ASUV-10]